MRKLRGNIHDLRRPVLNRCLGHLWGNESGCEDIFVS